MGTEQYVQQDWSSVTWALMLVGVVVVVFATMGLFLVMATRDRRVRPAAPAPRPRAAVVSAKHVAARALRGSHAE